jgi:hypothetical protein
MNVINLENFLRELNENSAANDMIPYPDKEFKVGFLQPEDTLCLTYHFWQTHYFDFHYGLGWLPGWAARGFEDFNMPDDISEIDDRMARVWRTWINNEAREQ